LRQKGHHSIASENERTRDEIAFQDVFCDPIHQQQIDPESGTLERERIGNPIPTNWLCASVFARQFFA
jgi:hypothetical protein